VGRGGEFSWVSCCDDSIGQTHCKLRVLTEWTAEAMGLNGDDADEEAEVDGDGARMTSWN
jgi:hypothetical protein